MGNWHTEKDFEGQMKGEIGSHVPKYSWIAKTNSDGTPNSFPISCSVMVREHSLFMRGGGGEWVKF